MWWKISEVMTHLFMVSVYVQFHAINLAIGRIYFMCCVAISKSF